MPLSPGSAVAASKFHKRLAVLAIAIVSGANLFCANPAAAQVSVTTYHNDNSRSGQNTSETFLTPSNVNSTQFGLLFAGSVNLDSWSVGQPLYVPNVTIAGQSHNVVYTATLNNSLYAFDADSGTLLWNTNYGLPTPFANLCTDNVFSQSPSGGAGIIGTPVIDPVGGIIYFVTKTGDGNVSPFELNLHAVDFTTGIDESGSPVTIAPTSGPTYLPEYQMSRPALLLSNGTVYVAMGSTGCTGLTGFPTINNHGYVFGFNASNLTAAPSFFITTPAVNNGGVWQSGAGPAADSEGNVYVETANAPFDYNTGGLDFGDSVLKLSPSLSLLDYFTPYNQNYLYINDLDLSSSGPLLLPVQTSGPANLMVATGKAQELYLINLNAMGEYCNNCTSNTNIVQDVLPPSGSTGCMIVNGVKTCIYGSPSYWNNNVYFPGIVAPMTAYPLTSNVSGTTLATLPTSQTTGTFSGFGSPSISSNGTNNGIVWSISWGTGTWTQYNGTLHADSATNLATEYYNSNQAANSRDTLGNVVKFITPTIANGKVYSATQSQLLVYGLLYPFKANAGNKQSGGVETMLPLPLTVQVSNPYTGKPASGVPVTFSDNGAGGTFGTPSTTTDSSGKASSTYTLPAKTGTYTITVSGPTAVPTTFSETAISGTVNKITLVSGGSQSGTVETCLSQPIIVAAKDAYGNLVANTAVTFSDGGLGGTFSANPVTTGSNGRASVTYTLPSKAASISITASVASPLLTVSEKSISSTPASVNYVSGNNQSAQPNSSLTNPLVVAVKDQYGNLVVETTVAFSDNGAGGTFANNGVATTAGNGRATITYTTSSKAGTVNISATVPGVSPFSFTETVQ
jgi:Bacterial Ig-like domain (group 1)/PQQ enzyme repeat